MASDTPKSEPRAPDGGSSLARDPTSDHPVERTDISDSQGLAPEEAKAPDVSGHMLDVDGKMARLDSMGGDRVFELFKTIVFPHGNDEKLAVPVRPEYHLVWLMNPCHPDRVVEKDEILSAWFKYLAKHKMTSPALVEVPAATIVELVTQVRSTKQWIPAKQISTLILLFRAEHSINQPESHGHRPIQLKEGWIQCLRILDSGSPKASPQLQLTFDSPYVNINAINALICESIGQKLKSIALSIEKKLLEPISEESTELNLDEEISELYQSGSHEAADRLFVKLLQTLNDDQLRLIQPEIDECVSMGTTLMELVAALRAK